MFSRINLFFLSVFVLAAGCVPKVGEGGGDAKETPALEATACLGTMMKTTQEYVKGTAEELAVGQSWDCMTSALDKFRKYVRGNDRSQYSTQELVNFVEQNFVEKDVSGKPKIKISVNLQKEVMKIKQILVGGSGDALSFAEIQKLIESFQVLRRLSIEMRPYGAVLFLTWKDGDNKKNLEHANFFETSLKTWAKVLPELGSVLGQSDFSYKFEDLVGLLKELEILYAQKWDFIPAYQKLIPILKQVKTTLVAGNENEIKGQEWVKIVRLGGQTYSQVLRSFYFLSSKTTSSPEVRSAQWIQSFEEGLDLLGQLVADKLNARIQLTELSQILNTAAKIWPGFKYTEKFGQEAMFLKQAILGGDETSISATDFANAKIKVARMRSIFQKVGPIKEFLEKDFNKDLKSISEYEVGMRLVAAGCEDLGLLFQGEYDLKKLPYVLKEALNWVSTSDWSDKIDEYFPLVYSLKNISLGQNSTVVGSTDWVPLMKSVYLWVDLGLFGSTFLKDWSYNDDENLVVYPPLIKKLSTVLKEVLVIRKNSAIAFSELNVLMDQLRSSEIISQRFKKSTLEITLKSALSRFFWPMELRQKGIRPKGIEAPGIAEIEKELSMYVETEISLKNFSSGTRRSFSEMQREARRMNQAGGLLKEPGKEFSVVFNTPVSMTLIDGHMAVSAGNTLKYGRDDLRWYNLMRLLTRFFTKSYSSVGYLNGLTQPDGDTALAELRYFFIDLGLLDPKNTKFIENRFQEANLYLPHSDGNNVASFGEINDLLITAISGAGVGKNMNDLITGRCGRGPSKNQDIDLTCAQGVLWKNFGTLFRPLVDLQKFRQNHPEDFVKVFNNILKASGVKPGTQNTVKPIQFNFVPFISQFMELMVIRFDLNHDGYIDTDDALKAYPVFETLFKKFAQSAIDKGQLSEKDLPAVFTYSLKYGHPPQGIGDLFQWLSWKKKKPSEWDVKADRARVTEILALIAEKSGKPEPITIEKTP